MRRFALAAALFVAAACGDERSRPAPEAPAAEAPSAAMLDDAALAARVLDSARKGEFEGLSTLELPPRCDRVRVAVRALHDVLTGAVQDPPPPAALLSALDALAKCRGGASATSLGPLVAAWRTWGDAEFAAEKDVAGRAAKCRAAFAADPARTAEVVEQFAGLPKPPPLSPATAQLAFFRALPLDRNTPTNAVPTEVAQAHDAARKLFDELGWPGGWASLADEVVLPRMLTNDSKSFLAAYYADSARAAYARSGDELRAALVFVAQSEAADRDGDFVRAERAAAAARDRILPTGAHGAELVAVLRRHGAAAQKVGKQVEAARDLGRALDEAKASALAADVRVEIAEALATSLFRLGRFVDAYGATREAVKLAPSRIELDEIAAESASELGRPAEAAALYRGAAARGDPAARDHRLLLAARALAKGGEDVAAAEIVAEVLSRPVTPPTRAFAAGVLREAKRPDDAERELTRAGTDGGAAFAELLAVERARIAAARGDVANARAYFGGAVDRLTNCDPEKIVGWDVAAPLLDWARLEAGAGRLYEASELAGRAVIQLRGSGLEWELDRARELYVDLQRRRGWFLDAEKATTQRLAADVGDLARREDVSLDLLFVRIELVLQRRPDAEKNALATAATFADDWRRALATDAVAAAAGRPPKGGFKAPEGLDPRARWGLLLDLVTGRSPAEDVASRAGAEEPELRRWALTKRFGSGHDEFLVEMRRRPDPKVPIDLATFVESEDEAVLLVEPIGAKTIVRLLRKGRIVAADVEGDAGLADFWDATWVAPSPANLEASANRVSESLFQKAVVDGLTGVKRLWISVPEPLGPLPFDLLHFESQTLLDRFETMTTPSLTELSGCRARASIHKPIVLASPYETLERRNALVEVGGRTLRESNDARGRLVLLQPPFERPFDSSVLREAKLAMRAEWQPDPKRPSVPVWAAFLLRGAP
jgi:tetratricopeptide (TPR) repeat protein